MLAGWMHDDVSYMYVAYKVTVINAWPKHVRRAIIKNDDDTFTPNAI